MFVRVVGGRPGIGKVIANFGATALVEYFRAYNGPVREEHSIQSLRQVSPLPEGTVVYFENPGGQWEIGQILCRARAEDLYFVAWAARDSLTLPESQLNVPLCDSRADPIRMLRGRTFTSPEFHDRRHQFLKYLMNVREAAAGMSGLVSSRIDLLPHQIEVVRRVLADPVQRYLLADEVGLGKTVEAGIILRQFLLDNPGERALLVAPEFLLEQWRWELFIRFTLFDLGIERVTRVAPTQLTESHEQGNWGLLIVDEAHHIAGQAFSKDVKAQAQYGHLSRIAHKTPRVLLLSATPVLHHERDFLGMLHLLDHRIYRLEELEQFEKRVRHRQRVGRLLLMLTEGSEPEFVQMHLEELKRLAEVFEQDETLAMLVGRIELVLNPPTAAPEAPKEIDLLDPEPDLTTEFQSNSAAKKLITMAVENSDNSKLSVLSVYGGDCPDQRESNANEVVQPEPVDIRSQQERLDEVVRCLRAHIGETYRLHRRLLRTRRETLDRELIPPRISAECDDPLAVVGMADEDLHLAEAEQLVDVWRDAAATAERSPACRLELRSVYAALAQAAYDGDLLACIASARKSRRFSRRVAQVFGEFAANSLVTARKFEGEDDILAAMEELSHVPSRTDRVAQLSRIVVEGVDGTTLPPKTVVFASDIDACIRIVSSIREALGPEAVASHMLVEGVRLTELEEDVKRFIEDDACRVLVCDRTGEEGRNLQVAKRVVHYDLPWAPNQIEQRMGRLDRIGQDRPVAAVVFTGVGSGASITRAWCRVMAEAFGIFGRSIAGLQFLVDRTLPELIETAFSDGPAGLIDRIEPLRAQIADEQHQNEEQYALDEMIATGMSGRDYIGKLEEHESRPESMQGAIEQWACDGLGLKREVVMGNAGVVKYSANGPTMIPAHLTETFKKVLNVRGTYDRGVATRLRNVRLFRIGEPFIEAIASLPDLDDRGRTFGIWRHVLNWDGGEWTGFRFCFRVRVRMQTAAELRLPPHVEWMRDSAGMSRQIESFFAPMLRTAYVTTDGNAESNERILVHLRRETTASDHCLACAPIETMAAVIDPSSWGGLCDSCLVVGERSIRDSSFFISTCADRRAAAHVALEERLSRLRVRYDLEARLGLAASLSQEDLETERALSRAILDGMTDPEFELDSAGFIVLSADPPPSL